MYKPECVLENETHKIIWDFDIQTDHIISVREPGIVLIKKKIMCHLVNFVAAADHRIKI